MSELQHLATSATRAYCGAVISGRNADVLHATCPQCLDVWEADRWADLNRAKEYGNAAEVDSIRDFIGKVRRARDARMYAFLNR